MNILKKGSKLFSIFHLKCPKCQNGNLFCVSNPYNLKRMLDMPAQCPTCHQDFKIEPGFYLGALWMTYPLVMIVAVTIPLIMLIHYHLSFFLSFLTPFVVLIGLQPFIMRLG
jgi:hypothetical protein